MRKTTFSIIVFVVLTLTITQLAGADYRLTNGTTEDVWAVYSILEPASGNWPEGWRTKGWYKIEPGATRNLIIPQDNTWVYIRVENAEGEIKPPDHETRDKYLFWIHPFEPFTVVETNEGEFLRSNRVEWSLEQADLYEYRNGGSHTVNANTSNAGPNLGVDQIYNQAMPSVVWIYNVDESAEGSGVLIDRQRKLVVTNQHVVGNADEVFVCFPVTGQDGELIGNRDYYINRYRTLLATDYAAWGKVIAKNSNRDLAIVRLDSIPTTAREIDHDFSMEISRNVRKGDPVHILGNPEKRDLWRWTVGLFHAHTGNWLQIDADIYGGNSGGPVLNQQGRLIGIVTLSDRRTKAWSVPAKQIKALLNTVPAFLPPVPPQQTYPKRTFKIRNTTGVTVSYQIRWSNSNNWRSHSLETGYINTHLSGGQNIPSNYPKIRFDHIAGDQAVTHRTYELESVQFQQNNDHAPIYYFQYNQWGNRVDLYQDNAAGAPTLSRKTPEETVLLSNYPNPFNPETWIPYKLAKPAKVTVTVYAADGKLVRTLALGHQPAGVYQSKSRAAYWDGRNELGEPVASGVYFYTLKAGEFTATRKMLIRK